MGADTLYSIDTLVFAYGSHEALRVEKLELDSDQIVVFAGENGSGKTTILKLLNGLLHPNSGTIRYCGETIDTKKKSKLRRETVLVHQDPYLFNGTVFQNVAYGLKIRGITAGTIREKVREKLALIGIDELTFKRAQELSGGQKQLTAIARALVLEPKVLMLDEPTASIHSGTVKLLESLILNLAGSGTTIILSTHNDAFAYRLSDRLISLEGGMVVPNRVNILRGSIESMDNRFSYFKTGSELLRCPTREGDFKAAILSLDDVILSENPIQTSAQNRFYGAVKRIEMEDNICRVEIDCGFRVEAHITTYSLEQLSVASGRKLHVTFKASALRLY